MNILGFESSEGKLSVAFLRDEVLGFSKKISVSGMQAELLVPTINEVLQKNKVDYADIDYLTLTRGPGSFTGIRVGLAAAEAMCLLTKVKVISFTNFDLYKYRLESRYQHNLKSFDFLYIILNAYGMQYYVQVFDVKNNSFSPHFLLDEGEILKKIEIKKRILCSGNGILNVSLAEKIINYDNVLATPMSISAIHLVYLACLKEKEKDFSSSLYPLYIKSPSVSVRPPLV